MKDHSWPSPYDDVPIPPEIIHAIGTVIVAWNWLDSSAVHFTAGLLQMEGRVALKIIGPLGNRSRQEVMQSWLSEVEVDEPAKDRIDHFIKLYNANLTNRNLIAHGQVAPEKEPFFQSTRYFPEIKSIWSSDFDFVVATRNEIVTASSYLSKLEDALLGNVRLSLPDKPPVPKLLTVTLPSQIYKRRSPQSSQA